MTTTPPGNADRRAELTAAEQRWQQSGASNYRIMVKITTFSVAQTNTVVVHAGKVTDQSATCNPLPSSGGTLCRVQQVQPETLTVPGLSDKTREVINGTTRQGTVSFDAQYGYPTDIFSSVRQVYDSESNEKVVGFALLP